MAKSRPTIMKRQRELARAEKRRDKAARQNVKKPDASDRPEDADDDYDPDIAHIVPGPQPLPWADELEDEEDEENDD